MLYSYNYKPVAEFKFRQSELTHAVNHGHDPLNCTLTFGAEIEVDDGQDSYTLTDKLDSLGLPIYCKYDGSLHSNGVEIVSHPLSLSYWKYDMRLKAIARECKAMGYKSENTETCGLHIHVGRFGLGSTNTERRQTAAKLVLLVDALWDQIVTFSRRRDGELNNWAPRPRIPAGTAALVTAALRAGGQDGDHDRRYTAVNLTNEHTVEFRVFKGSLNRNTVIAAIELCSNLCKFAMTHTPMECHRANWADVVAVEEHKELNAYCALRGIA